MDKIIIKDARFLCNIGVAERERRKKQEIFIDVELFLDIKKMAKPFFLSDDLKNTVNYLDVYTSIKRIVEEKGYKLIEALAENVAYKILQNFNVSKVVVRIKKPNALADKKVKYVAIEIMRKI